MSNAPQGPGWWQASDGNWYPPEQHPGYTPPPPTATSVPPGYQPAAQSTGTPATPVAPQSWSAPPAAAQYPAPGGYPAPGSQTYGNPQPTVTAGIAKAPLASWLLVGGFVVAAISLFLPAVTASFDGQTASGSLWSEGGVAYAIFFVLVAGAVLSLTTFARPQSQRRALTILTVLIGLLVIQLIYNWFTYDSQMAEVKRDNPDISDVNFSPGFGLFLYTAAIVFLAVRIAMHWTGRSKAQPQAF